MYKDKKRYDFVNTFSFISGCKSCWAQAKKTSTVKERMANFFCFNLRLVKAQTMAFLDLPKQVIVRLFGVLYQHSLSLADVLGKNCMK